MKMSENLNELASALAKFQEEVKNPSNTATNPQFRSKYAPLDVVINTAKPILSKYGLSFIQSTGSEEESISVSTLLLHESGQWIQSERLVLPAYQIKKGGEKDYNAQGAGSSLTYARRYSLSAILGLSSEDDDDGNGASSGSRNGYKEATSKEEKASNASNSISTTGGLSAEDKEKRRQDAIAKAKAKSSSTAESQGTNPAEPPPAKEDGNEQITTQQERAIGNLLNVLSRKKGEGFDQESFLTTALSEFGLDTLSSATSEQAKLVITSINKEMRS